MEEDIEEVPSEDCGGVWLVAGVDEGCVDDGSNCTCRPPGITCVKKAYNVSSSGSSRWLMNQEFKEEDEPVLPEIKTNDFEEKEGDEPVLSKSKTDDFEKQLMWPQTLRGSPRRQPVRVQTSNRFNVLKVQEEDDIEEMNAVEEVNEVNETDDTEEVNEMVEITVDSGAARSVWPKKKKSKEEGHPRTEAEAGGSEWHEY